MFMNEHSVALKNILDFKINIVESIKNFLMGYTDKDLNIIKVSLNNHFLYNLGRYNIDEAFIYDMLLLLDTDKFDKEKYNRLYDNFYNFIYTIVEINDYQHIENNYNINKERNTSVFRINDIYYKIEYYTDTSFYNESDYETEIFLSIVTPKEKTITVYE